MDPIVRQLARVIGPAILGVPPPLGPRRPSKMALYGALKEARPIIEKRFGAPVFCRYSGSPERPAKTYSKKDDRPFKVLEYLWDFSLSRYAIPQAIDDPAATPMVRGKFELLFVAESELGTSNEICRDLLKLLEARTSVRCLIYRQPKRTRERQRFEARMVRVMHNHAYFRRGPGAWLFLGLSWGHQQIQCDIKTLGKQLDALTPVRTA